MPAVALAHEEDYEGWRDAARGLALADVPPSEVTWEVGGAPADLFSGETMTPKAADPSFPVPRAFPDLARAAICHSDPERFSLLYTLLLRIRAAPGVLEDKADPLLRRVEAMAKAVRRDIHKMHAFVRFREVKAPDGRTRYVAWFEPDHHIVRNGAGFFVRRFHTMHWSILTPELCVHWDGENLTESPGATRAHAPSGDPVEEAWKTYYASTFNPARVKVKAMTKEMPRKYWKNMPETALVGELIAGAQAREAEMVERSQNKAAAEHGHDAAEAAERRLEPGSNALAAWEALFQEARGCTRCHLHEQATQTVFGEGPVDAPLMFVGEQPGDMEDLAGRPFVGPAGQLFDKALAEAGIDRARTYVTNAVKHFKFTPRGKRRLHQSPQAPEIRACRWWYEQERQLVQPAITVALGATAVRQVFGQPLTISSLRGAPHCLADGGEGWATVHPSFLLRVREDKEAEYARFVEDLARIGERVKALG